MKKQTTGNVKAIGGGAIVTGLLLSSSIVNLLVFSMVGAGVVKMENALALMLGANQVTTLNSWKVATLGFNFNIENFVLPVAGITGICLAFINSESKWFLWFKFLFSLSFLFVALGFIKSGMEEFVKQTDLSFINQYPIIVFLLLGIVLTTIVQSSSATIALTLSALHTHAITLFVATAIVLGSEIGTTFKLFLASAKGLAIADLALEALENETKLLINHVIEYSLYSFNLEESIQTKYSVHKNFHDKAVAEKYDYIKQLHGEMHGFY